MALIIGIVSSVYYPSMVGISIGQILLVSLPYDHLQPADYYRTRTTKSADSAWERVTRMKSAPGEVE